MQRLGESVSFDKRLYREDIFATKVHTEMLSRLKIITENELQSIHSGLDAIQQEIENGNFQFKADLEDIHSNIERSLSDKIGSIAGKIHTARSRNDQVITDTMLWLKKRIQEIEILILDLIKSLLKRAEEEQDSIIPGYTHLQVAQPVRLSHHLLAYVEMLRRDLVRLRFCYSSLEESPLGAGAMAGVNYPIDRFFTADKLGFNRPSRNSIDTVSNRDWLLDFHYFAATLFIHISRLSEELIIWSSSEFQFVQLDESVSTGSSIMPQKKNPDSLELSRGKSGRIIGNFSSLLVTLKGLPLTYNRDLQEDKEGLFDSVDTLNTVLPVLNEVIQTIKFRTENMENSLSRGYALATDVADYLVNKGIPFRQTHEIVGSLIQDLSKEGKKLEDLSLSELKQYSEKFEEDFGEKMQYSASADRKQSYGSTSATSIKTQLQENQKFIKNYERLN